MGELIVFFSLFLCICFGFTSGGAWFGVIWLASAETEVFVGFGAAATLLTFEAARIVGSTTDWLFGQAMSMLVLQACCCGNLV